MKLIQILGPGCPTCARLRTNAEGAVAELGLAATVEMITDMSEILRFDVLMTPALVIDGEVRMVGKAASVEEIKRLLVP